MAAGRGVDTLRVELRVHRVRAPLARMELPPDLLEADVIVAPAEGARPVTRGERGGLVEEEELGELPRLEERPALPPLELEPAGDPPSDRIAPADTTLVVVQAAAVPVHEAACRIGDQLAERRDPVLQRHKDIFLESPQTRSVLRRPELGS